MDEYNSLYMTVYLVLSDGAKTRKRDRTMQPYVIDNSSV